MGDKEKRAIKRIGRSIVAIVIEEIIRLITGNPWSIAIIPGLQGLGKYLRDKWGLKNIPV